MNKAPLKAIPTELVPRRENSKLGIWLFIGGDIIFFSTLILSFGMIRFQNAAKYAGFREHLSIPLIGLNTFILIASSYLVVRALSAIQDGHKNSLRNNLIGVIVLGALFLAGQAFEWTTLFRDGVGVNDLFAGPFFTVTGLHGTHVFIGLIWCSFMLANTIRGHYSARSHLQIENFGLYWHFVDIVWIILFTLIYLI
jgi:cytochrome c oxidase subunit 3/cytochrome o ubiquinol oxidase subunit 3